MAERIAFGDVYVSNGVLRKKQVVLRVEDEVNFTKAPIWANDGVTLLGLAGGGDISEILKIVGRMNRDQIAEAWRNYLIKIPFLTKAYIEKEVSRFNRTLSE